MDVAARRRRTSRRGRCIDIDPGTRTTFDDVLVLARLYRTALDHLGVIGRPKVTGQRGIQIWVPIAVGHTFDDTRARGSRRCPAPSGATVPELVSWKWHKSEREGLARLDYTQNAINRTLVAPFSVRAGRRCAGVRADRVGRARRPGPAAGSLEHCDRARAAGGQGRPLPDAAVDRAVASAAVNEVPFSATS